MALGQTDLKAQFDSISEPEDSISHSWSTVFSETQCPRVVEFVQLIIVCGFKDTKLVIVRFSADTFGIVVSYGEDFAELEH